MRIRKLEINGFKSFGDRALLSFGNGITGIVGPNGCGKSNVVDALRWCMGEMSAKHLRGREMLDVIFAGSDSRGPMGLAEVTITLDNDGNVPPQYADYSEIAVTRRLHKDGTSEYLVNKVQARLRDITDLFLGTGAGTRAYSIIEQGRIGFIVSSRPEDRRSLIEEVAGITRYKARKKAAERRMEATEQNLLRVTDIVTELARQLESLRRQAKKAERYKRVKDELQDLELHAASLEYLRLTAAEKVQAAERDKLEHKLVNVQTTHATAETGMESERLRLVEVERQLTGEQQQVADLEAKLAALERDLSHWREQVREAALRAQSAAHDVQESKTRLAQLGSERNDLEAHAAELVSRLEAHRREIAAAEAALSELQQRLAAMDARAEAARAGALEHVHTAARERAHAQSLDRRRTDLNARRGQLTGERDDLSRRAAEQNDVAQALLAECDDAARKLAGWRDRMQAYGEQWERSKALGAQSEARLMALSTELTEKRSRLGSLTEIAQRFEGYSDGVRTLMTGAALSGATQGIKGLVTDVIEAPPELERAIEAALGDKLQYLIVESQRAGASAIEYLKERAGGRGGFIPLLPRTHAHQEIHETHPGIVGPALAKVSVKPTYEAMASYLLGDVVIVDALPTALDLWTKNGHQQRLVTLDGEVLDPAGVLEGGSDHGTGLLAKRREARELAEVVRDLTRELELARSNHEKLTAERLQLEVNRDQLDKDSRTLEIEKVQLDKDLESAQADSARLSERMELLALEIRTREDELYDLDREQARAQQAASEADLRRSAGESEMQALNQERVRLVAELAQRAQALTARKVQLAAAEEKERATRAARERLNLSENELRQRVEREVAEISEGNTRAADVKKQITQGEARAQELAAAISARKAALAGARAAYDSERGRLTHDEQGLRERRREGELLREALTELKLDVQRLEMERVRLCEQMAERYQVDLARVVGDYHARGLPPPEAGERRARLEASLKNMGPINLTAIEECAEVEKRHGFLSTQRDDLTAALDALKRAVQRINRASRERFKQAFEAVNDMFQQVFPRLFRGGEARLTLVDSEDLLEAGVEIVAQPPGKKLQSVSLLSGGEKALTAVALVFAIFLIKPSPFCVLDEVDAPLDDVNVGRFNEMLREIAQVSQFIVITHNKETMTECDRLFGITMEEAGLSKVVSVDLSSAAPARLDSGGVPG
ncbi:MAG: chromosome segregation protein SMC [Deltaproteobacteria bacterium]|nr:chromosome segregation protein SMC [Deltaproteobacteria bacterium]